MRRLVQGLAVALALVPITVRALPAGSGASDPSIVIGIVATTSGAGAIPGQDLIDGFSLALRQLGGRFANQEVRVVITDDKGSPDTARQQVKRLMERERLDIVLTAVSPASMIAIIKPLTEARLFVLDLDQAPAPLAGPECSPFLFGLAAPADGVHEALGQHLAAERMRRLVVIGPDAPKTNDAAAALKRTFHGEVAAVLMPKPGATTYESEIARIHDLKPDAVYTVLSGGMGVAFVRAYHAAGLRADIPLFAAWPLVERPMLPAMGEAAVDVVSISPWSPDLDSIPNKRLVSDFESEYGRPATTWAAQGYDSAFLLDAALKATNGKTGDSEALRAGLRRADFVSVRGGFKFNTNHFPVLTYYLRKVTRDAKGRLTHEMGGAVLKDWRDRQASSCPLRWVEETPPAPVVKKP
jgi:branched-chain amino acid transport system substrate-binding protein